MKRKLLTALCAIGAIVVIIFLACENPFYPSADAEVPTITAQPQGAVYTVGKPAVALTVGATTGDEGSLSYQWYSNKIDNASGGTAVIDAVTANYTPPTTEEDVKYYYVVVTNVFNGRVAQATSKTARIEVNAKVNAAYPQITRQPGGNAEYTFLDASAPLTVAASVNDGGTLSYKWYRNTTNSKEGRTEVGTNSDSFIPPTDASAGTMYYYVEVINTIADNDDGGNKTASRDSDFVSIKVNPRPIETAAVNVTGPEMLETPDTTASTQEQGYDCGLVLWSPAASMFAGSTVYTATVTLTAKANYIFDTAGFSATINGGNTTVTNLTAASVTISHAFGATLASQVKSIAVQQQPSKLTYIHGEELDLSGLLVRLTYEDNTYDDVAPADFGSKNISAVPADGTELKRSTHNGERVAVHYGARSDRTQELTVAVKTLTVSGAVHTRPYDGSIDTDGIVITLSGIIPSETDTVGIASVSAFYPSPSAGTNTVNVTMVTLTGSDSGNYTVAFPAYNIVVGGITKVTPTITAWPSARNIIVGNVLSSSLLTGGSATGIGGASLTGVFTWTTGSVTPAIGTHTNYTVTFTPTDQTNYNTVTSNSVTNPISVTVETTSPIITWPTAASIVYEQQLSASVLSGGSAKHPDTNANIPGTFAWASPTTVPLATNANVASSYLVRFTPNDTGSYSTMENMIAVAVSKKNPVITWPTKVSVNGSNFSIYGYRYVISDGSACTSGNFVYLGVDNRDLRFTPNDTANYNIEENLNPTAVIYYSLYFYSTKTSGGQNISVGPDYSTLLPKGRLTVGAFASTPSVADSSTDCQVYAPGTVITSFPGRGTMTRTGYTFIGWSTTAAGLTETDSAGQRVGNPSNMVTLPYTVPSSGNQYYGIRFYPVWQQN